MILAFPTGMIGSSRPAMILIRFDIADTVRQIVGVGSVGMRVYLVLLVERRTGDPFFRQINQAVPSVYERFLGGSPYGNHGQRVINGQRMIHSATDMFVEWTTNGGHDFYVRQLRDGKVIPKGKTIIGRLAKFAAACAALFEPCGLDGDAHPLTHAVEVLREVDLAVVDDDGVGGER
jgi:hypothetical protein